MDFLKNIYLKANSTSEFEIENNYLYLRSFLENNKEINELIENKIQYKLQNALDIINAKTEEFKTLFDNFTKTNIETINNANYELIQRFNQLENLFYSKDNDYKHILEDISKSLFNELETRINNVYNDISKVYSYINSENNQKGAEINKIYDEISKNYKYTEKIIQEKIEENNKITHPVDELKNKLQEVENNSNLHYCALKNLINLNTNETEIKLQALTASDLSCYKNAVDTVGVEKALSENMDNIYNHINKTSAQFYEELTRIYKELNEKIIKLNQDN